VTAITALFTAIKGAGWTTETLKAIKDGLNILIGPGASPTTIEWLDTDTHLPVADGDVWVTTDAAGANVVEKHQTNSLGKATFMLDAGLTYYLWGQKDGHQPIQGESFEAE